jgi:quercetin dioxygenase-like cupin family protein
MREIMESVDPGSDGGAAATTASGGSSPRPTYEGPTAIPYARVTRFLWGDDESGQVADWIYASTDKIHMLVYGLPADGRCLHSDAHRTIFGADVTYHVLEGTLVLANPECGEVRVAHAGETILFRRDTWHHIFSHDTRQLRVLEFFAPPPSTGTSRAYARQRPYLTDSRHADDSLLGTWPAALAPATLHLRRGEDRIWRLDGDALVGIIVSTEHLTVGSLSLMPGKRSAVETHGGDECLYVTEGVLHVQTSAGDGAGWHELRPGDGFYCPDGISHQYFNVGDSPAAALFGVAPNWRP